MNCSAEFLQAFESVCDERFDEYLSSLEDREPHVFSKKHEKKMAKLIKRQRKPYFNLICTAGRRAACIIVAVIVFTATALSVKAVREAVFRFIKNTFSDHSVIKTEGEDNSSYPETIEVEYYISDLPEGFVQTQVNKADDMLTIVYTNGDRRLFFNQYTMSAFKIYVDNEHNHFDHNTGPDGTVYEISTSKNNTMIIWNNEKYVFMITGNLNKDELMELCKSTKLKE